jgi:hypothetical protein
VKGLLVALMVVSVLATAALVVVPFRPCPTCNALTKKINRTDVRLNCPDCGDRGKVSFPRSQRGPGVPEHVARLIRMRRRQYELLPEYRDLLTMRSRWVPDEVTGYKFFGTWPDDWDLRFIRAEEKTYLVVLLSHGSADLEGQTGAGMVLLSPEGVVLDYIHATHKPGPHIVFPAFVENAADGTIAGVRGGDRSETIEPFKPPVLAEVYQAGVAGSRACPSTAQTPSERVRADGLFRVGIMGDRFTFIDAGRR